MFRWLGILFGTLRSSVRTHRELALKNLALRQQVAVLKPAPAAVTADGDGPDLLGSGIEAVDESAALSADPQPAPARAFQCDGASDGGMDGAATAGSLCTKRRPHICH